MSNTPHTNQMKKMASKIGLFLLEVVRSWIIGGVSILLIAGVGSLVVQAADRAASWHIVAWNILLIVTGRAIYMVYQKYFAKRRG